MAKKKGRSKTDGARRVSFTADEKGRPWLKLVLDAFYIVDKGIAKAVAAEEKKGRTLACRKGCSTCCSTHKDIPVYPLEIIALTWFATEKITGHERHVLKKQLADFKKDSPCPFLIEGACSVHPLRPMACRQFNVFGTPCKKGEDPFYTRREDVMDPVKKYVDQAFFIMLPYYGVEKESERISIVETGAFHKMVKELHSCNWTELAAKMDRFDREI